MKDALKNGRMPEEKKAEIIYRSTVQTMKNLLDDPEAMRIAEVKQEITGIIV